MSTGTSQPIWGEYGEWQFDKTHEQYYRQRQNTRGELDTQWYSQVAADTSAPRGQEQQYSLQETSPHSVGSQQNYTYSQDNQQTQSYEASGAVYDAHAALQQQTAQSEAQNQVPDPPAVAANRNIVTQDPSGAEVEPLDPTFARVRNGKPQRDFFVQGRVFAVLWTEPLGSNTDQEMSDAFSLIGSSSVPHGERAHTEIRRFIVLKAHQWHSICVPILSYRDKGAGHRPDVRHHAIAFTGNSAPAPFRGEHIDRVAIKIDARSGQYLKDASRINFCQIYTVQHNVKVKAIGRVNPAYIQHLIYYYRESAGV